MKKYEITGLSSVEECTQVNMERITLLKGPGPKLCLNRNLFSCKFLLIFGFCISKIRIS